jgi:DNA-nicking Smr family endonuclease
MSFGDILDDWDKFRKEEIKKGKQKPASPKAEPREERAPSTREQVLAYLNRFGVPDKDLDIDKDLEEERSDQAERERVARMRPEASIDLHGRNVETAMADLRLFLDNCARRGFKKVLIVHGKGNHSSDNPVMKQAVREFLESYPGAGRSGGADRASGGSGATWLILKRR